MNSAAKGLVRNYLSGIMNLGLKGLKQTKSILLICLLTTLAVFLAGCQSPSAYRREADTVALNIIQEKQEQTLGKSETFIIERPSDILRRRLLVEQHLPYSGDASLGSDKLKQVEHWPEKDYPGKTVSLDPNQPLDDGKPLQLTLHETLQIGARNSFDYQTKKEDIFRAALDLDLERNTFRNIFKGTMDALLRRGPLSSGSAQIGSLSNRSSTGEDTVTGTQNTVSADWRRTMKSGVEFGAAVAIDLVKLLTQDRSSSLGLLGDATITIPLLRGSGRHIVTEPMTQAERNVVYAIYEFERFKKSFAVNIASSYLDVLRQHNVVENTEANYRNLITSTRRTRRMAEAGRISEIEVGQALQNELRARNRWISAQESYKSRLDAFKTLIGLPPDADIVQDRTDLEKLLAAPIGRKEEIAGEIKATVSAKVSKEGEPVELVKPTRENAGPLEMEPFLATKLGLENRLDLRVSLGKVFDAQRKVVVLADALGAELTLFGSAELGESRSITTANLDNARLRTNKGLYSALLTIDLPFERTAERNAYRNGFIALEQAVRDVQKLEDEIKLSIRDRLRSMYESRESLQIQTRAVVVAEERVKSTALFFEAGRAQLRDVLDAEEALITARNELTSAAVAYRVAELEFQRDTGLLQVDEKGLWREYTPEESNHDRKQ